MNTADEQLLNWYKEWYILAKKDHRGRSLTDTFKVDFSCLRQ